MFSFLTARFLVNDIYKEVVGVDEFSPHFTKLHAKGFAESIAMGITKGRLDPRLADFDLARLAEILDTSRDGLFEFMGVQVLYDRYFIRDGEQVLLETPQYFWMRIAMGLALLEEDKNAKAIEFYHTVSRMLYVPSTPTLLHSGTHRPQVSACFLSTAEDDLSHIFKVIGDNAQLSKTNPPSRPSGYGMAAGNAEGDAFQNRRWSCLGSRYAGYEGRRCHGLYRD